MDGAGSIHADARRDEYMRSGWTRFDEQGSPHAKPSWSEIS